MRFLVTTWLAGANQFRRMIRHLYRFQAPLQCVTDVSQVRVTLPPFAIPTIAASPSCCSTIQVWMVLQGKHLTLPLHGRGRGRKRQEKSSYDQNIFIRSKKMLLQLHGNKPVPYLLSDSNLNQSFLPNNSIVSCIVPCAGTDNY